jgi:hypothetical protein
MLVALGSAAVLGSASVGSASVGSASVGSASVGSASVGLTAFFARAAWAALRMARTTSVWRERSCASSTTSTE